MIWVSLLGFSSNNQRRGIAVGIKLIERGLVHISAFASGDKKKGCISDVLINYLFLCSIKPLVNLSQVYLNTD